MRFSYVLLVFLIGTLLHGFSKSDPQNAPQPLGAIPFITTWKTDNPGSSDNTSIIIPTAPGELYNYTVDWGDGSPPTNHTGDATHTYAAPGTYTVSITGLFPRIYNASVPQKDPEKLLSIEQWGDNAWTSMNGAFRSCSNLIGNFVDTPDLSNVTDMSGMFAECTSFNSNIANWNVGTVTDMSSLFNNATAFDQDLGNWNMENVTNLNDMFLGATLSTTNYDALLLGWDMQNLQPGLAFNAGNSQYCDGAAARANRISADGWTIADGGPASPIVNDIPHQTHVNAVVLPAITGTNLTGREGYYTGPNGTGMFYEPGAVILFGDFPAYPVTLYIYDGSGSCATQQEFNLTLTNSCTPPTADILMDVTDCNSFTLPALNAGNTYYTQTNAGGVMLTAGDVITDSQTLYIYVGTLGCSDESSFNVTISKPLVDSLADVTECTVYTLPPLNAGDYYTASNGNGTLLNAGDAITLSQTLFIYSGDASCWNETSFSITINDTPVADAPEDVQACGSYTLPNLSLGNAYFTESAGGGTRLNPGDIISSSQTLFVYAGSPGCFAENSFVITIDSPTMVDVLENVTACGFYLLPVLENGNYFTEPGGSGIELFADDQLSTSQTIYVYFASGSCSSESSFQVTITAEPCDPIVGDCTPEFSNFFTPNGDGIHDRFEMRRTDCGFRGELRIFDRYGKLVFQTMDIYKGWDGTFAGKPLPAADYWYQYRDSGSGEIIRQHFALKR